MQSPPHGVPWASPSDQQYAKTNGTAVFALIASLSGFVCLMGVGGVLGFVLGLIARNEIKRSEGRETGRGLATASVVLGGLNVGLTVLAFAMTFTYLLWHPSALSSRHRAPTLSAPGLPAPAASAPAPAKGTGKGPPARASHELGTQVTSLGALSIADISGDFESELAAQRAAAQAAGETLLLWLVVPSCKPCDGVAAALTSPAAQKALAKVRFVRVNRDEYQVELDQLGIPTEKIPGFALLDSSNHPRDFIHGGEWDADIAANIAPVLGKFAHGGYAHRRHPWHGAARDDETSL